MDNFVPNNMTPMSQAQAMQVNPLVFAFVGDTVHTLYVKSMLIASSSAKASALHTKVSSKIKAKAQAEKMQSCMPLLTEQEKDIFMRARNSHVNTIAKNASLVEYKQATCYEAIIGYLYLTGQHQRLSDILNI